MRDCKKKGKEGEEEEEENKEEEEEKQERNEIAVLSSMDFSLICLPPTLPAALSLFLSRAILLQLCFAGTFSRMS